MRSNVVPKSGVLKFSLMDMVIFALISLTSQALAMASPMDVIRTGTDEAMQILNTCQPGGVFVPQEHRDEILRIVNAYFDFNEMSMRALGRYWKVQSPQKQEEFVKLFRQLLINSYIDKIHSYTCTGKEQVLYDEQSVEGSYAVVKTRVTGYRDTDVPVDYRLTMRTGEWKVYDVVVEGISLVNNYRQQFNSILASQSFDSLLGRIRDKVASFREG